MAGLGTLLEVRNPSHVQMVKPVSIEDSGRISKTPSIKALILSKEHSSKYMEEHGVFEPSCEMIGKTIHCSIDTDIEKSEFAFYVNLNGERKATFWYTDRPYIEYSCGDEIIYDFQIVFFIRIDGENIISKSIKKKTSWSICDGVLEAVRNLVDEKSVILELGSGMGSRSLAEICTVFSVEHDERFLDIHQSVNYIHAPLIDIEPLSAFNENKWYDSEAIRKNLPEKIDLVLVDGQPEKYGRSGLLHHLDIFGENCIWIIDDVLREKDQKLANYISFEFDYIQYRFWNFSILSKSSLSGDILDTIKKAAMNSKYSMSANYVSQYYPKTQLRKNTI